MAEKCDEHKLVCQEVADLKAIKPVGSKQMWAVIVLFIVLATGIVGWLYEGQVSVRSRLDTYQDKLTGDQGILTKMDKKIDRLEWMLDTDKSTPGHKP